PIERTLRQELGVKMEELIIEENPIGTASIGQVHKAVIRATGEVLALKVQYPGVDLAIENDLKIIKQVFKTMSFIPKGPQFDSVFDEVREMLVQELNYETELKNLERIRKHLAGNTEYILPKSYPRYSTKKVLAMSYETGLPVDSENVKMSSPETRRKIGELMLMNYFQELLHWGVVQTDPHFGNYRVRLDVGPKLVLFDFGALRILSGTFIKGYRRLIKGVFHQDRDEVIDGAIQIGFLSDNDDPSLKQEFANLCLMMTEPFMEGVGEYDFSNSTLPKRAALKGTELVFKMKLRPPPRELVFLDRKMTGVFIFLGALKVPIDGRKLFAKALEEME
ncbi:MAG: AarF/ABC1/UbiB kinase family protein, partial [Bdellovibrionales bacterium]|nr:AarF/ABC1/UbiB kinase family protein [Bdellovibrionales bacterium]